MAPYEKLEGDERSSPWVGPFIYDQMGELIWAGPPTMDHYKSFDLRVQDINGTDMLTVINPHLNAGLILDNSYNIVKEVTHSNTFEHANMHDFNIVQNGTRALVLTKEIEKSVSRKKAKAVGLNKCMVHEDGIKYLGISTPGEPQVLFSWNGTDHIGLDETTFRPRPIREMCSKHWDIHHFNSIDQFPDGDFLLSSRHTDTLYKISQHDGSIVWRLGGVKSDFAMGRAERFTRQHHARVHSQNETMTIVSVFDNAKGTGTNATESHPFSRGLILALNTNTQPMWAELLAHFDHPREGKTTSRGSTQILPNENVFMCWAYNTLVSEHAPDGRLLMDARLKKSVHTYRAYKHEWTGLPTEPPNVYSAAFVAGSNVTTSVYVSWNGATEVRKWNLLETDKHGHSEKLLGSSKRTGFETPLWHHEFVQYVVVEALDETGRSLGRSEVIQTIPPVEAAPHQIDYSELAEVAPATHASTPDWTTMYNSADSIYSQGDSKSWSEEATDILTNPLATFASGFIACAVICAVFWAAWNSKLRLPFRRSGPGYEQLSHGDQRDLADDEILEKV